MFKKVLVILLMVLSWKIFPAYSNVQQNYTRLISGIKSFQTIEQFENYLKYNKIKWEIGAHQTLSSGDKRPAYDLYIISIKNYSDMKVIGELNVIFFNNKLMSTKFFPKDNYVEYIKRIKKQVLFEKNQATEKAFIPPDTEITIYPWGVEWSDRRLKKELKDWYIKYD